MNAFKNLLGIFWLILAPLVVFALIDGANKNIGRGTKEINDPVVMDHHHRHLCTHCSRTDDIWMVRIQGRIRSFAERF